MRDLKGYFVCGKDHRENDMHNHEDVSEAIKKLIERHPTALLTVEGLGFFTNLFAANEPEDDEVEIVVEWHEEEE